MTKIPNPNKDAQKLRKSHNSDLIRRMRKGETLTSYDSVSSWFPPRPTIEQDEEAIKRVYGDKAPKEKEKELELIVHKS